MGGARVKAPDCSSLDATFQTVLKILLHKRTSNSESKAVKERANTEAINASVS